MVIYCFVSGVFATKSIVAATERSSERRKSNKVDELRHIFDLVQKQPDVVQRHIAEVIALELEVSEWDAIVGSEEGQQTLERLAAEARAEIGSSPKSSVNRSDW